MKPLILVTNDDGVHAAGIKHLYNALKDDFELVVVAPSHEQSASGLAITVRSPLQIQQVGEGFYSVSGTPGDCVKMALSVILKRKPDLILSGINRGSNAGRNIFYSGTVSAVIEGVLHDVPGIAFSCYDYVEPNYQMAEKYVHPIVHYFIKHTMPHGTLMNINFPAKKLGIQGFKMVRQGKEFWIEDPESRSHPSEGHSYWWLGSKRAVFDEHEESDIVWLDKGYITAVPVYVGELTHNQVLEKHKETFEEHLRPFSE